MKANSSPLSARSGLAASRPCLAADSSALIPTMKVPSGGRRQEGRAAGPRIARSSSRSIALLPLAHRRSQLSRRPCGRGRKERGGRKRDLVAWHLQARRTGELCQSLPGAIVGRHGANGVADRPARLVTRPRFLLLRRGLWGAPRRADPPCGCRTSCAAIVSHEGHHRSAGHPRCRRGGVTSATVW